MCNDLKKKIARRRIRIVDDRKIAETLKSAQTGALGILLEIGFVLSLLGGALRVSLLGMFTSDL
jgi:uncharacterized membrane protein